MGLRLVVFNDQDPDIGIDLTWVPEGTPGVAHGWRGSCTECGKAMHFWTEEKAFESGQQHVDSHRP